MLLLVALVAVSAEAKQVRTSSMYMFGFSASFKDSVIYMTDVQQVEGAWIDTKTKFLLGRENYSHQLKEYLADKLQQPERVCMVFFAKKKKKAEKLYLKMKRKYVEKSKGNYDVRYLNERAFKFEAVEMEN